MTAAPPSQWLRLSVANRIEMLSDSMDQVEAFLTSWNVEAGDRAQVMIILDEIASNIIHSAWPDGGLHHFHLALQIVALPSALSLVLTATDDGVAFDPTTTPPPDLTLDLDSREPGGLGLFMVGEMSDAVEYCRVGGCNQLQISKQLQRAEQPV